MMHKLVVCLLGVISTNCAQPGAEAAPSRAARKSTQASIERTTYSPDFDTAREKPEVTPELAAKAQQLLREHGEKPIGTAIPFVQAGKRYTARIEEHENLEGDPSRPPGKHKGITVYQR
jgi:hypothetical protein